MLTQQNKGEQSMTTLTDEENTFDIIQTFLMKN